jgi:hypothetical protein
MNYGEIHTLIYDRKSKWSAKASHESATDKPPPASPTPSPLAGEVARKLGN